MARRGAMYTFLRRQYERQGDPPSWLRQLASSSGTGLENIAGIAQADLNTLLARHWWTLALAGRDPLPGYTFRLFLDSGELRGSGGKLEAR